MITVTSGHGDFRQLSELPRTIGGQLSRVEQLGGSMVADSPDVATIYDGCRTVWQTLRHF
jgi:hypothetical protein